MSKKKKKKEYKALALKNAFLKRNACLCAPRELIEAFSQPSPVRVHRQCRKCQERSPRKPRDTLSVGDHEWSTLGTHPFPSFVFLDLIHPKWHCFHNGCILQPCQLWAASAPCGPASSSLQLSIRDQNPWCLFPGIQCLVGWLCAWVSVLVLWSAWQFLSSTVWTSKSCAGALTRGNKSESFF